MTRPLCKCHGEPMYLRGDPRRSNPWRCAVPKKRENTTVRGDRGMWMKVLRITKVSEVSDGA